MQIRGEIDQWVDQGDSAWIVLGRTCVVCGWRGVDNDGEVRSHSHGLDITRHHQEYID